MSAQGKEFIVSVRCCSAVELEAALIATVGAIQRGVGADYTVVDVMAVDQEEEIENNSTWYATIARIA